MGRHWAANGCPPLCGYAVSEEEQMQTLKFYLPYLGTKANSVSSQDIGSFYWAPPAAVSGA